MGQLHIAIPLERPVLEPTPSENRQHNQVYLAANKIRSQHGLAPLGDAGKSGRYFEAEAQRLANVYDEHLLHRTKGKNFTVLLKRYEDMLKDRGVSYQIASGYQMSEEQARQKWENDPQAQKELLDKNAVAMGISSYTNPQTGERTWVRLINHNPQLDLSFYNLARSNVALEFIPNSWSWEGNEEINETLRELVKHGGDPSKGDMFSLDGDKRDIPEQHKKPGQVVIYWPTYTHTRKDGMGRRIDFVDPAGKTPDFAYYDRTTGKTTRTPGVPYGWNYQTIATAGSNGTINFVNIGRTTGHPGDPFQLGKIDPDFHARYQGYSHGSFYHLPVFARVEAQIKGKEMDLSVINPQTQSASSNAWFVDSRFLIDGDGFKDKLFWNSENKRFEGAIPGNNAAFFGPNGAEIGGQFNQPLPQYQVKDYWDPNITLWNDEYYRGAYGAVRVE